MVARRVQVLLEEEERRAFQEAAKREGVSLSAWLRGAGSERLAQQRRRARIRTVQELAEFFEECRRRERGTEPDWEEHLKVITESVARGRASS